MNECEETTCLQPTEPSANEDVIVVLNRLIQVNYDAINGYKLASQWAEKSEYADLFQTYRLQREGFVAELGGAEDM